MREKMFAQGKRMIFAVGQSANLNRIVATITWIALVSSMLSTPLVTLSSATYSSSVSTGMHKTEDIFGGSFSPQEVIAAPNEIFDVSFSMCPTKDAPNTVINLVLPSDLVKLVDGDNVWTGNVKKGETVVLSLSFATNGDVDTYVRAGVEASDTGKNYRSSCYLHVATPNAKSNTEKGTPAREVTSDAKMRVEVDIEPQRATPLLKSSPSSPGSFRIYGRWWYWNDEISALSVGRYMLVEIWDKDDDGYDDYLAEGWTDGNGYFDITAPNIEESPELGTADPYIRFKAMGKWDWYTTNPVTGNPYWWHYPNSGAIQNNVPDGWVYNAGDQGAGDSYQALQAGDAVYAEMEFVREEAFWSRSRVNIQWPVETWPHSHGDSIDLPATGGWDHVSVQHEDGHCVMWTLYGNSWPEGFQGGSHWIGMEDVLPDAWVEGYAEFMECAVDGNPNNLIFDGQNIETNDWYNWQDTGDMDGYCVEGEIASILWDIFDGINETERDYLSYGYDHIFYPLMNGAYGGGDDNPNTIFEFWDDWKSWYSDISLFVGPLCSVYWDYGIDVDSYAPWGSIMINGGALYTKSTTVTLTLSADDWGGGVGWVRFSFDMGTTWTSWYAYATTFYATLSSGDGWKWVDVQYEDYSGNTSPPGTIFDGIYLDTTSPTGSIVMNSGATYTNSRWVTLTLSATDSLSGVAYMRFADDYPTLTWSDWYPYATTFDFYIDTPGDGSKAIDVQFMDWAGNPTTPGGIWDTIILDTTPPTGSITINSGDPPYTTSTSVTLYLSYGDSLSGVKEVYYADEGEVFAGPFDPTDTMAWTLPSGDGTKIVYYRIFDNAGNSYVCGDSIVLDTAPPTGSIVVNSGAIYTNSRWVTLTLSASDSGSGVAYMRFADDWPTLTWSAWYPYATTFDFYIDNPTEGPIYIDVQFIDSVGNPTIAGGIYDTIVLDTRPHDIAVVDVTTSKTSVGSGYPLLVYVTVENHGPFTASFNLTAYYGNSGITAEQWEAFWSLGDVNRDGYINGTDQNLLSVAFGTTPESLNWNPWADLNQDLNVNMNDIAIFAYNYGLEIWTYAISGGVIETLPVIDLAPGNTQTLTFTWDTSSIPYDHYVICGYAVPILAREDDRADNTFVDGTVTVTIAGDTDADGDVDYDDFIILAGAYGSSEGQPAYNPEANIDGDVDVDYDDFIILAGNYGKSITLP